MTFDKHTIIRVEWKDAHSGHDLYSSDLAKALEPAPYLCVGFKLGENSEMLVIAQGICPPNYQHEETLYRQYLSIPKALITKIEELQVKNAKA